MKEEETKLENVEENTDNDSEEEANGESDSHIEDNFDKRDGVRQTINPPYLMTAVYIFKESHQ